ncbi:MAG: PDZ domain-containing protein [Opitutaceae bacterium]|nr:PDZ domain-containing protein [Opitutaceae bacterium]
MTAIPPLGSLPNLSPAHSRPAPGLTTRRILLACAFACAALSSRAAEIRDLWKERLKSVVAIEFFTETELDRRPTVIFGTVIDKEGTVVFSGGAVNVRSTPSELKDFRVYLPGENVRTYASATYIGQDVFTTWQYVKVAESLWPSLVPITAFAGPATASTDVQLAQQVWGIALRAKDEDFAPYILSAQVGLLQTLPQRTAVCMDDVAGPGLPVFDAKGVFLGFGMPGFAQSYLEFSKRSPGGEQVALVNIGETGAFQLADEILPFLNRRPLNVYGRSVPWFGWYGLQPTDPEVAAHLKIDIGVVVSEVLAGSPAEQSGLQPRDVVVAMDGKPLPRLKPDRVMVNYLAREIARRAVGDVVKVTVLRNGERVDVAAKLVEEPKLFREADRKYFDKLGFTAREFVYADGIMRRAPVAEHQGVIAHFVKANSPAATAGLVTDDWIKEIDGTPITSYKEAIDQLGAIQADSSRTEAVLLIRRGGDTQVLRIKLK